MRDPHLPCQVMTVMMVMMTVMMTVPQNQRGHRMATVTVLFIRAAHEEAE